MMMNDPLGDMLTRIRNAQMRGKSTVMTPASTLRARVLEVLLSEGYIRGWEKADTSNGQGEFTSTFNLCGFQRLGHVREHLLAKRVVQIHHGNALETHIANLLDQALGFIAVAGTYEEHMPLLCRAQRWRAGRAVSCPPIPESRRPPFSDWRSGWCRSARRRGAAACRRRALSG